MADRSIKVKLEAEVSQYKKDLEGAAKATEKLAASSELAAKNVDVAAAKQKSAATKMAAAEKQLQQARESGKSSATQLSAAEQKVAEAKRTHWKASKELENAQESLTRANLAQAESALKQQSALGRASAFYKANRSDIDSVGNSLMVTGVAGVAALGSMTKSAMSWESAWAGVTKTVNGSDAEMASLEAGLRDLAKTLPSTHEEIAAVAESAGALGVARKDVLGFTSTMIDLGETTNLTADDAATNIAQISNVMKTLERDGAEGVERFGATLVALGNDGASTEAEILAMAQRIAGAGATLKASESDVLALANTLASMGVNAELGGGVTTRVLLKMRTAVDEGGESLHSFASVAGLAAEDFAQKFRTAPMEALDLVAKGINRVNESGGNVTATMKDMGVKGTEETQVMLALANSGDLLTKSLELGARAWEENTALADEAGKRYQTTESQVTVAWNNVKDAAIDVGQYVLPILADLANGVANVAEWFGNLPEPVQAVITAVGGFGSVAALAVGGGIKLVGTLSDSFSAAARLSKEMPRTSKAIKGVGVAAGVATIALTAFMTAAAYDGGDSSQGINEIEAGLKRIATGSEWASDELFKDIGGGSWLKGEKESLEDLLNVLSDDSGWVKFNNGFADAIVGATSWTGIDTRGTAQMQRDNLFAYGQQLARMAETDMPTAAMAFKYMNEEAGNTDESAWKLIETLPGLKDAFVGVADDAGLATDKATILDVALGRVSVSTTNAGDASASAAGSVGVITENLQAEADAADDAFEALMNHTNALLGMRDAKRGFEDALDKASEAIEKNGKTLDVTTEKGRANQAAIDDIVSSGLAWLEQEREQGASQERLDKIMAKTRKQFIAQAEAAGMGKEAAKKLADSLGLIPGTYGAKIDVDAESAKADIQWVSREIRNLPNGKTVTITTNRITNEKTYRTAPQGQGMGYEADGGRVQAPKFADGGRLPRTGLGTDQILGLSKNGTPTAWVDDREWVINNRSSDKFNTALNWINNDDPRIQHLAGLANGGRIGDYEKKVKNARAEVKAAKSAVSAAKKTKGSKDDKSAAKRLDKAEEALNVAKDALAELKSSKSDLSSGVGEKTYTYNEKTGKVETSNALMDQGMSGLSGAYGLVEQVKAASKLEGITSKQSKAMAKAAKEAKKEFEKLYKEAAKLEAELAKAEANLAEMRGVASGVKSGLVQGFSLGDSIKEEQYENGRLTQKKGVTGASMISDAKAYKAKLTKFGAALKKLADWGASSVILQEIAGYGPDDGLLIANSLSKAQVEELNGLYESISSKSGYIGNQTTRNYTAEDGTFYANGVYEAKEDVIDLRSAVSANESALKTQTDKLLDAWGKPFEVKHKNGKLVQIKQKKAFGGAVLGEGTETSDSILARLSTNEHVWAADEVRGAGGHSAVGQLRALAKARALSNTTGGIPKAPANAALLAQVSAVKSASPQAISSPALDYDQLGAAIVKAFKASPMNLHSELKADGRTLANFYGAAAIAARNWSVNV